MNITGVYPIYPDGVSNAVDVFCDMETDDGGWTVGSNLVFITFSVSRNTILIVYRVLNHILVYMNVYRVFQ